jgi:hypothetical protein
MLMLMLIRNKVDGFFDVLSRMPDDEPGGEGA